MAGLTLGLDVGANSLGWALVDETGGKIHASGVRIFPEGVDREATGAEISKNAQRRNARAMRRQITRRAKRKRRLRKELVAAALLPAHAHLPGAAADRVAWEKSQFKASDPYTLRRRAAAGEKLEPFEIGRALLHLNQHRGFLSNRKTDREKKKENSAILQEISAVAAAMGERTLGTYLAELRGDDASRFHLTRLRGKHTRRDMYTQEFAAIWEAQQRHHPALLTPELRERLFRTIFFQRPLRPPSPGLVGRCELERRLPRCPRADRRAQLFRLLQEVNNLRVTDMSARTERRLSPPERDEVIKYLRGAKERTFDQIKKRLFEQHENIRFNLERGGRTKLDGMRSDAALKACLGRPWEKIADELKDRIVAAIIDDDEPRLRRALGQAGIDEDRAPTVLDSVDLPSGYSSYSLHAIKKLLPHVERAMPLTSRDAGEPCALRAAGYLLPWESVPGKQRYLPEPPGVTNPLVRQALHEVRKVVNAILREHVYRAGHELAQIRLELAREVRGTAEQRAKRVREMRERESNRDEAAQQIRDEGHKPTRESIDRYLLWREQDEICVYSGKPISLVQLFSGEVDVDHILPYSRTLDNSLMNRVLGFRVENAAKGNRTPFEWLGEADPVRYEQLLQRVRSLPYPKFRRFYQTAVELDDFFARQFVDTAYITTQVFDYVRCLGADVLCPNGRHTAELRRLWGLDTVLRELRDAPAWRSAMDLPSGEKNRLDHRHHAVDAIVIALTNQPRLQQLARVRRFTGVQQAPAADDFLPWPAFRDAAIESLRAICVSHRVRRKVAGALHEESIYGPTATEGELVIRKPVGSLTCNMVHEIRDPVVREKVVERLRQLGIEPGRGKDSKIPAEVWREPLWMNETLRIPITKVRLIRREKTVQPIRGGTAFVKPGNTHHLCLFEISEVAGRTRREAVFVSMIEAKRRIRAREPLIQKSHPSIPNARFLMSLSGNEMLLLDHGGQMEVYRYDTAASTSGQMWFKHHAAGGKGAERIGRVSKMPSTFSGQKITVDPIGRIRRAGD